MGGALGASHPQSLLAGLSSSCRKGFTLFSPSSLVCIAFSCSSEFAAALWRRVAHDFREGALCTRILCRNSLASVFLVGKALPSFLRPRLFASLFHALQNSPRRFGAESRTIFVRVR